MLPSDYYITNMCMLTKKQNKNRTHKKKTELKRKQKRTKRFSMFIVHADYLFPGVGQVRIWLRKIYDFKEVPNRRMRSWYWTCMRIRGYIGGIHSHRFVSSLYGLDRLRAPAHSLLCYQELSNIHSLLFMTVECDSSTSKTSTQMLTIYSFFSFHTTNAWV